MPAGEAKIAVNGGAKVTHSPAGNLPRRISGGLWARSSPGSAQRSTAGFQELSVSLKTIRTHYPILIKSTTFSELPWSANASGLTAITRNIPADTTPEKNRGLGSAAARRNAPEGSKPNRCPAQQRRRNGQTSPCPPLRYHYDIAVISKCYYSDTYKISWYYSGIR